MMFTKLAKSKTIKLSNYGPRTGFDILGGQSTCFSLETIGMLLLLRIENITIIGDFLQWPNCPPPPVVCSRVRVKVASKIFFGILLTALQILKYIIFKLQIERIQAQHTKLLLVLDSEDLMVEESEPQYIS